MIIKLILLFSAVTLAFAAPPRNAIPNYPQPSVIPILSQSEEYEQNGTYKFSYETGNGIKREETSYDKILPKAKSRSSNSDEGGEDSSDSDEIHVQRGSYSYVAPDGSLITVRYIADENGFRPIGVISSVSSKGRLATQSTFGVSEKSGRQLSLDSDEGSSAPGAALAPVEPQETAEPAPVPSVKPKVANNESPTTSAKSDQVQAQPEKEIIPTASSVQANKSFESSQLDFKPVSAPSVESRLASDASPTSSVVTEQPQLSTEKEATSTGESNTPTEISKPVPSNATQKGVVSESETPAESAQSSTSEVSVSETPTTISDFASQTISNTPSASTVATSTTLQETSPTESQESSTDAERSTASDLSIPREFSTTSIPELKSENTEPDKVTTLNPKSAESTYMPEAVSTTASVELTSEPGTKSEPTETEQSTPTTKSSEKVATTSEPLSTVVHEESSTESASTATPAELSSTEVTTVSEEKINDTTTSNENSSTTDITSTSVTSELTSTEPTSASHTEEIKTSTEQASTSHTEEINSTTELSTTIMQESTMAGDSTTASDTKTTVTLEAESIDKTSTTTSEQITSTGTEVPTTENPKA